MNRITLAVYEPWRDDSLYPVTPPEGSLLVHSEVDAEDLLVPFSELVQQQRSVYDRTSSRALRVGWVRMYESENYCMCRPLPHLFRPLVRAWKRRRAKYCNPRYILRRQLLGRG